MDRIGVVVAAAVGLVLVQPGAARADASADANAKSVCLQPLGKKYNKRLLAAAKRGIEYLYGFEVRILDDRKLPKEAYYKPRRRYRADKLLTFLDDNVVPTAECDFVMGFTHVDISVTKGKFKDWGIFGLAALGGPSGVVSTHRLRRRASRKKQGRRTINVMNHELGHALGVPHVEGEGCLMADAQGTIKTVDNEP
jgi:archaemetzincin